jgi:hypothetical protein
MRKWKKLNIYIYIYIYILVNSVWYDKRARWRNMPIYIARSSIGLRVEEEHIDIAMLH